MLPTALLAHHFGIGPERRGASVRLRGTYFGVPIAVWEDESLVKTEMSYPNLGLGLDVSTDRHNPLSGRVDLRLGDAPLDEAYQFFADDRGALSNFLTPQRRELLLVADRFLRPLGASLRLTDDAVNWSCQRRALDDSQLVQSVAGLASLARAMVDTPRALQQQHEPDDTPLTFPDELSD